MMIKGTSVCRAVVVAAAASVVAPWQAAGAQAPDPVASGVVFLDVNQDGDRDAGEAGIANVSVSNGHDVVQTDAGGRYEIALPPEHILFVSKPAEYRIPVDDDHLPRFYYLHYPDGTPPVADWDWPVIAPTGPLPTSIDFPLLSGDAADNTTAMAFADPQTATDEQLDMLREDVIDELVGNPYGAEFGIVAGDVVNDNLGLYARHNTLMGAIGIPIWNVPGNHDLNRRSPDNTYATQTFKSVFGPDYYSFDYGQAHVLALNNVEYQGEDGSYRGYLSDEQIAWIANDLEHVPADRLIVILTHIPLLTHAPDGDGARYGASLNTGNLGVLLDALSGFDSVYAIAGHDTSNSWKTQIDHTHGWNGRPFIAHTLAEVRGGGWERGPRDERGVRAATMSDGNPNGYYVLEFDGPTVTPHFIPAGGDRDDRLRLMIDPPIIHAGAPAAGNVTPDRGALAEGAMLVVNLFDGGERDQVWMSVDGEEPVPMTHRERTDPFVVAQAARFAGTPDAFASPALSSHIWELALPRDLDAGLHTITVTVLDEFGLEFQDTMTFEITPAP